MSLQHEIELISKEIYDKIAVIEKKQKQLEDAKKTLKKLLGDLTKLMVGKTPSLSS